MNQIHNNPIDTILPKPPIAPVIDPALLDVLLHEPQPITAEALSLRMRMPIGQVIKKLGQLTDANCQIEFHPQRGVSLEHTHIATWMDYIRWVCDQESRRVIEVYGQTTSTQDAARRIVASCGHSADAAIVVADVQTAGRGRLGRRWIAPAGTAITFTRVCLGRQADLSIDRLTLATAAAVTQAIQPYVLPNRVEIKWPNDLLIAGRKVAGILVEVFSEPTVPGYVAATIGVGINVSLNPQQLPDDDPALPNRATSIWMDGRPVDRLAVLAQSLRHIDRTLSQPNPQAMLEVWRRHCPMLSQKLKMRHNGQVIQGQVIDLDPWAGLIVQTRSGTVVHLPAATTTIL